MEALNMSKKKELIQEKPIIQIPTREVVMDDSNGYHLYSSEGKSYPSVTTILSAISYNKYIVRWANSLGFKHKNYEEELDRTAVEGTFMHEMNQAFVDPEKASPPIISEPLVQYYVRQRAQAFQLKMKLHEGHWSTIFTEMPMVSHTYEMGGTMDWMALWYDRLTLFDYKSSSGLRQKHLYQLGGYDLLLQDNGIKVDQMGIILCKRDNCIIHLFERDVIERCSEIFLEIKKYYEGDKEITAMMTERAEVL